MIDQDGYRANVAIVLLNEQNQVLWCRRVGGQDAWQFPQGGMQRDESELDAMHRELQEEVGLLPHQIDVIGRTQDWLRYDLPDSFVRKRQSPVCIGQKQIWFLLKLTADESAINLNATTPAEFDDWRWVAYDEPSTQVVDFKQAVYQKALAELKPLLPSISKR